MQPFFNLIGLRFDYTREMLVLGLILARTLPMVFLAPFMAGQAAPPEVKMGMGVFFSVLLWPVVSPSLHHMPLQALPVLLLFLKETFIGLVMGFLASLLYSAMETAGRIIDTCRGSAMSELLVPNSRSRATAIGTLFSQITLVVFVCCNGHRLYLDIFFRSFESIPLAGGLNMSAAAGMLPDLVTRQCANVLAIAAILAAPAVAATFITDLVFGILNRVAPQLNAYFMAMPVKAVGALTLLLVSTVPFYERLLHHAHLSLISVQSAVDMMAPIVKVP